MYSPPRSKNPLGFGLGSEYGKPLPGERALLYPASYSPSSSTLSPLRFASNGGGGTGAIHHHPNNSNLNPVTGNPLSPRAKLSPLPISNIIAANGALTTINNDNQNNRRKPMMMNFNGSSVPSSSSSSSSALNDEYSSTNHHTASKNDIQSHASTVANGISSETGHMTDPSLLPSTVPSSSSSSSSSAVSSFSSVNLDTVSNGNSDTTTNHPPYSTLANNHNNDLLAENILRAVSRMMENRLSVEETIREGLARELQRVRERINTLEMTVKEKDNVNEMMRVKQATTEAEVRILRNDLMHTVNRMDNLVQTMINTEQKNTMNNHSQATVVSSAVPNPSLTLANVFNDPTFRSVANQAREAYDMVEREIRNRTMAEDAVSNRLSILHRTITELQQTTTQAIATASVVSPAPTNTNPMTTPSKNTFSPPTSPTRNFHRFQHTNTNHQNSSNATNDDAPHIPMIARSAAEAAMMDPGDDPSLYANRVVTRSILETYLSGLRSQIESESNARKTEIDQLTADYAARLDRAVGEIVGFRGLVREEVTTRVDSVVDAVTTAVSELATKATAASVSIGSLTAAFNEEKQWSRDDSALLRDMINKRCNSIEEVIRVQAQARTKKEQALGDAIIRGLQQEQHNRELGNNGISNRLHDIHTTIDNLRNSVVNNATESASALVAIRDELAQSMDVRMNRIDNDLQLTVNNFMDRHDRTENSIRTLSSQTDERLQKMMQDLTDQRVSTEQVYRTLETEIFPSRIKDTENRFTSFIEKEINQQNEQFNKRFSEIQDTMHQRFETIRQQTNDRTNESIQNAIKTTEQRTDEKLSTIENDIQRSIESLATTQNEDRTASLTTIMMLTEEIKSTSVSVNEQFDTWSNRILADIGTWQEELQKEIDSTMESTAKSIKTHNNHLRELQSITQEHAKSLHDMAIVVKEGFKLSNDKAVVIIGSTTEEENEKMNGKDNETASSTAIDHDEHTAAATKIQALARGRQARKEVENMRDRINPNEPAVDAADEAKENNTMDSVDADAAAAKIQALARGRQARAEVQAMKESLKNSEEQVNSDVAEETEEEMMNGSTVDTEAAATKIQALARGRQARKEIENLRNSDRSSNNTTEAVNDKPVDAVVEDAKNDDTKDTVDADAAAVKIQALARGRQARLEVQAMKETMNSTEAGDVPPENGEEKEKKDEIDDSNDNADTEAAATKIQALARGRQARKEVENMRSENTKEPDTPVEDAAPSP